MSFLYHAHSGLRYIVLLVGVIALIVLAWGAATGRPVKVGRGLTTAFVGLLDLQVLLGIGLVIGGIFYGALMGHITLMVIAAIAAHVANAMARRRTDERDALRVRLAGVVVALLCIVFGILAIGRSIFGSGPMSMG